MSVVRAVVVVMALAGAGAASEGVSYEEVRTRLHLGAYAEPPSYPFSSVPELSLLINGLNGSVLGRFGEILEDGGDFKDARLKPVHRDGICAEGLWSITERTPATGLLSVGTEVPAVLRFAAGTNRTVASSIFPRTLGIAVKLFPSSDRTRPVKTANLFLFDQDGLDGSTRPHFLVPASEDGPLYFSNVVRATSPTARATNALLARFDRKPHLRPLYPLTEIDGEGRPVDVPLTPHEIHLVPRPRDMRELPPDFRAELMTYAPGELVFDILLPGEPGVRGPRPMGTLTVGRMVMSPTCDETLNFAHPRAR